MDAAKINKLQAELAELEKRNKEIAAKRKRLDARRERLRKEHRNLEEERNKWYRDKERLELVALIGQQVKLGYRLDKNDKDVWLNGATGVLLEVKRTRCRVDFGDRGTWTMQIRDIIGADAELGFLLPSGR